MDAILRDWAGLPVHIVDIMVIMLNRFSDYIRFCGICSQWRYAALEANVVHKVNLDVLKASRRKLPMLIFKTDKNSDDRRSLYDVTYQTIFNLELPFPYRYRFAGSSCGWLFCLDKTMVVTLVNPINNGCISLPAIREPLQLFNRFFDFYIKKGILLSDPRASLCSFEVVVIYSGVSKLAFFKSGEPSWNFIDPEDFFFGDIIHYKGKLYGVEVTGKLVQIDLLSRTLKTIVPATSWANVVHLVESQDGELLMVKRKWLDDSDGSDHGEDIHVEEEPGNKDYCDGPLDDESESYDCEAGSDDDDFPRSFEFKVFKLTHQNEEGSAIWVEIKNIGQQALFVGDNHSVSVSTSEFSGCLPNSVYYLSQHHHGIPPYVYRGLNEDSGIFDLRNETFYWHHMLDSCEKYIQPPIWFVPNPQEINMD